MWLRNHLSLSWLDHICSSLNNLAKEPCSKILKASKVVVCEIDGKELVCTKLEISDLRNGVLCSAFVGRSAARMISTSSSISLWHIWCLEVVYLLCIFSPSPTSLISWYVIYPARTGCPVLNIWLPRDGLYRLWRDRASSSSRTELWHTLGNLCTGHWDWLEY